VLREAKGNVAKREIAGIKGPREKGHGVRPPLLGKTLKKGNRKKQTPSTSVPQSPRKRTNPAPKKRPTGTSPKTKSWEALDWVDAAKNRG